MKRTIIMLALMASLVGLLSAQDIIYTTPNGKDISNIDINGILKTKTPVGNAEDTHLPSRQTRDHTRGEHYVGNPNSTDYSWNIPAAFYNQHSLNQTIYQHSMINQYGTIKEIIYPIVYDPLHSPHTVQIWMTQTTKTSFTDTDDWISFDQFTLVYDSPEGYLLNGINQDVYIELDTPFNYTQGNLVIMTNKVGATFDNSPFVMWLFTTSTQPNCTIHALRQPPDGGFEPEYYYPSTEDDEYVITNSTTPNLIINFADDLAYNLSLRKFDGSTYVALNSPLDYSIVVKNNGNMPVSTYSIKLMSGSTQLTSVAGNLIQPGETLTVYMPYSFTTSGTYEVNAVLDFPENEDLNNMSSSTITTKVYPAGYVPVFVGEKPADSYSNQPPHDSMNKSSLAQMIYLEDMLKDVGGSITEITFYYLRSHGDNPPNCVGMLFLSPTELEMVGYTGYWHDNMFEPFDQYTEVFNDILPWNVPAGANIPVTYQFSEPYQYEGGNLSVMTFVPWFDEEPYNWATNAAIWEHYKVDYWSTASTGHNGHPLDLDNFEIEIVFWGQSLPNTLFVCQTDGFGSLTGTVVDNYGQPVHNALVELNFYRNVYTNADGKFRMDIITPGHYSLNVSKTDYDSVYIPTITIVADQVFTLTDNIVLTSLVSDNDATEKPMQTMLKANYPNPFNPSTTIDFTLAQPGAVKIDIFNIKGQKVKTLIDDAFAKGSHSIVWNGTDNIGKPVSSGLYFYKMSTAEYTSTRKMLLMK